MRKRIGQLLTICLLSLTGNVSVIAQETQPAVQAQRAAVEKEQRAAAKAAAEKKRTEIRAARAEKRAAAKALESEKRTLVHEKRRVEQQKRALANEKRHAANEKRAAARVVATQKRALEQTIRQATRPEGTFRWLGSRPGGKVVKGAPYSATATTEYTQTLSDGNRIIQKNEATYYRDSEGRTRIDQKLKTIGKWTTAGEPPRIITIFDPVAGNYYSLDPRTRTALLDARGPQKPTPKPNPKPQPNEPNPKPKVLTGQNNLTGSSGSSSSLIQRAGSNQQTVVKEGSGREKKKQSLGTKVIEGVSAEGARTTVIIPAGEIGNVAPIEIIDESWYSPELQVPVITSHHDPRSGNTIYKLTNINRSEPARSVFEVPSDYRIVDRRAPKPPKQPEEPRTPEPAKKPDDRL